MKIRLLEAVTIEGREYAAEQTLSIAAALGQPLVDDGTAEALPDDAGGCFVEHSPA